MSEITITSKTVNIGNRPAVELRKPDGLTHDRVYGFSINFCDRTTWYHDAVQQIDNFTATEGVSGAGQTVFQLTHGTNAGNADSENEAIIDLSHGKVGDENDITNPSGQYRSMGNGYVSPSPTDPYAIWSSPSGDLSGYVPVVKLNDVEQNEREYGETTGGNYEINYKTGELTFYSELSDSDTVEVTYYWIDSNAQACITVKPPSGKKYVIDKIEVQATADVVQTSSIINNVYVDSSVFGLPAGTMMASRRPTVVKNQKDIHNWAHVTHPEAPTQGPGAPRGIGSPVRIHEVKYLSEVPLLSSYNAELRVHLSKNREFEGTWGSVVIYGITDVES